MFYASQPWATALPWPSKSQPPPPQPVALSDQQYLVPDNQVLVSIYVNAIGGSLCILGFIILRGWIRGPGGVFQRRQELQDLFMRPPQLILGTIHQIWNWAMPLFAVSDADVVRCCGFDALILTRVLLIGLQLFTFMTIFGVGILLPVYYTRGGVDNSSASLGTMARLTIANISTGSHVYVLPFIMTYIFIGYGCWVLFINCKCYAQLRIAYFTCLDALPSTLGARVPTEQSEAPRSQGSDDSTSSAAVLTGATGTATSTAAKVTISGCDGGRDRQSTREGQGAVEPPPLDGSERLGPGIAFTLIAAVPPLPAQPPPTSMECQPVLTPEDDAMKPPWPHEQPAIVCSQASLAQTEITQRAVATSDGVTAATATAAAAGAAIFQPTMWLGSTWVNLVNFFNPTLRMMLDHLDWQNPLQRTAARLGVRGLELPALTDDEVPTHARLYDDPLLAYDNLVSKIMRETGEASDSDHGATVVDDSDRDGCYEERGRGVHSGGVSAVLPYWRPAAALRQVRESQVALPPYSYGAGISAPLSRWSSSSARQRKVKAVSLSTVIPDAMPVGIGTSGTVNAHNVAAEVPLSTTDAITNSAAAAVTATDATGIAPTLSQLLRYSLRHVSTPKLDAANSVAVLNTDAGAAASAATAYGMSDPRQPLLPGKRNVRLLQLLQVPSPWLERVTSDVAIGTCLEARADRASVRACVDNGDGDGVRVNSDASHVRLVNANHYVVLIKRVHNQRGPDIWARMAALSYIVLSHVRVAALWATEGASRNSGSLPTIPSSKNMMMAVMSSTTHSPHTTAESGMLRAGSLMRRTSTTRTASMAPRTARKVAAVAVAMAATAAPLHGMAKAAYEVQRFYEMFDDPGIRQFDPLWDVRATDLRSKARKPDGRSAAFIIGSDGGDEATAAGVAAAVPAELEVLPQPNTDGIDGEPMDAATNADVVAEKAMKDAAEDPTGAAIAAVLRDLFPKSFQGLMPVINHDAVDKLVFRWDAKMLELAAVVRDLQQLQVRRRQCEERRCEGVLDADVEEGKGSGAEDTTPAQGASAEGCSGGSSGGGDSNNNCWRGVLQGAAFREGELRAQLRRRADKLRQDIGELESQIETEREHALRRPVGTAYFAMFSNSQDAQMLAQCRRVVPAQAPGSLLYFDAVPAPAPDDVNWPALWSTGSLERALRRFAIVLPMAAIFVLPFGLLQGALASLDASLCAGKVTFEGLTANKLYVKWFCEQKNLGIDLARSLLTGVLPSVLGLVWTSVVMPHLLYLCSSLARSEVSLSGQERQMQQWFFWYSLINTFLGAVLGSSLFSQLGAYLADPKKILDKIGRALPNTANFFIQFCIARALCINMVRLVWPHAGAMMGAIFRSLLRLGVPRSLHAAAIMHMPPSARATTNYNAILQVFMFGCGFAVVAPIILPCCWLFFLTGFITYRYSLLYTYQRSYESGGLMWPLLFDQIMGFLLLMEVFTGASFLVNGAWFLAGIIWITLTPLMMIFWRYCTRYYLDPLHMPPLSVVAAEPRGVHLSPLVYLPPALRPGALGWYPEQGKVWEKYGIPKHY